MKKWHEILDNWAEEQFNAWYAVDELTHEGERIRLLVTDRETAMRKAADLVTGAHLVDCTGRSCDPGEFHPEASFYRCTIVSADEAKAHFDACEARMIELHGENWRED